MKVLPEDRNVVWIYEQQIKVTK